MKHVFTEGILACWAFVNDKFNGVLKFAGTVKIRGLDTASTCKSRGSRCRISYGSTLKLSGRRRSNGVHKYYVNGYRRQPLGTNGETEFEMLKFWTYYETAKFTWNQSDWLARLELRDFEQENQLRVLQRKTHRSFVFPRGLTRVGITAHCGHI